MSSTPGFQLPDSASEENLLRMLYVFGYLDIENIARLVKKLPSKGKDSVKEHHKNDLRDNHINDLVVDGLIGKSNKPRKGAIRGTQPIVYSLTKKGKKRLDALNGSPLPEVDTALRLHLVNLNDLLVSAVLLPAFEPKITLAHFEHEISLKQRPIPIGNNKTVVPDGFVWYTLCEPYGKTDEPLGICFEWDEGSETPFQLKDKFTNWMTAATGDPSAYKDRFGTDSLTIAFCCSNEKRAEDMVKIAEEVLKDKRSYAELFLFGAFDSAAIDPLTLLTTPLFKQPFDTSPHALIETVDIVSEEKEEERQPQGRILHLVKPEEPDRQVPDVQPPEKQEKIVTPPAPAPSSHVQPQLVPCKHCGANNPQGAKFCNQCASSLLASDTTGIYELTEENYKDFVSEETSPLVMVVFVESQKLKYEKWYWVVYEKLAEEYKRKMKIGKVGVTANQKIASQYDMKWSFVRGHDCCVLYKNGKYIETFDVDIDHHEWIIEEIKKLIDELLAVKELAPLPLNEAQIDGRSKKVWMHWAFTRTTQIFQAEFYYQVIQTGKLSSPPNWFKQDMNREEIWAIQRDPTPDYAEWRKQEGWRSLSFQAFWSIYKKLLIEIAEYVENNSDKYKIIHATNFGEEEQVIFYKHKIGSSRPYTDNKTSNERDNLRITLFLVVNELNTQEEALKPRVYDWFLEDALEQYLKIRKEEIVLRLPATPVPDVLAPYFQNVTHPELQKVVNRFVVLPSSAGSTNR